MLRNWEQVYRAANLTRADRVFFAFSFGPFLGFWTAFESAARLGALCFPGGGMSSNARLRAILDSQTTVLCCTPSYAMRLAEVATAENISLAQSPVKLLLVAGEPGGCIPATRSRLQELWPGARVFDHHGMTEVGPVTYECPDRPGVLHVHEMAYVAEIIEPATGKLLHGGETGELVLTTLGRVGSPVLRYRTGDLVKSSLDTVCHCGRNDLALEGGILGRVDDMVVVRGVNVYPSAVEEIIRVRGGVEEYRVRVSHAGTLTELAVDVEFAEPGTAPEKAAQLERDFDSALALRVPVSVVPAGTLPRPETKAQRWIKTS
jgi:phenylacetate-CoA ligase